MVLAVPATVWSEELDKDRVDRIPIYCWFECISVSNSLISYTNDNLLFLRPTGELICTIIIFRRCWESEERFHTIQRIFVYNMDFRNTLSLQMCFYFRSVLLIEIYSMFQFQLLTLKRSSYIVIYRKHLQIFFDIKK